MKLIDADRLLQHTKFYNLKNGNRAIDEIDILHAPTVNAISLDKVKQAKEEMKECSYSLRCFNEDVFDEDERVVDLDNVLIILDKIIESEGK